MAAGKIVETDETYIGRDESVPKARKSDGAHKNAVLTLVERGGKARSFHVENITEGRRYPDHQGKRRARVAHHDRRSRPVYQVGAEFASHQSVDHSREEYAYYDRRD